jgi:hypothetical protein
MVLNYAVLQEKVLGNVRMWRLVYSRLSLVIPQYNTSTGDGVGGARGGYVRCKI